MAAKKKIDSNLRKVQIDRGKVFVDWFGKRYAQPKDSAFRLGHALSFVEFSHSGEDAMSSIVVACPALPLAAQENWKFSGFVGGEAGKRAALKRAEEGAPTRHAVGVPASLIAYESMMREAECIGLKAIVSFQFPTRDLASKFSEAVQSAGDDVIDIGTSSGTNGTYSWVELEVPIEKLK